MHTVTDVITPLTFEILFNKGMWNFTHILHVGYMAAYDMQQLLEAFQCWLHLCE